MKEGLEEFLKRIEEKPNNETLIDRFISLVLEEEISDRIFYLKKLVGLLLHSNPYTALKVAALELQEARKEADYREYEIAALKDVESCFLKLDKASNASLVREEINKIHTEYSRLHKPSVQSSLAEDEELDLQIEPAKSERKARLHFRLPDLGFHGSEESTRLEDEATVQLDPEMLAKQAAAQTAELRQSALKISSIGVGPNLLDSPPAEEVSPRRKASSVFDESMVEPEAQTANRAKAKALGKGESSPVPEKAEPQQFAFPEDTDQGSLTGRFKTAVAKALERKVPPPKLDQAAVQKSNLGRQSLDLVDEDTGQRETKAMFSQEPQEPTMLLDPEIPIKQAMQPRPPLPEKPKVMERPEFPPADFLAEPEVSLPAADLRNLVESPADEPAYVPPARDSATETRRWEVFRERLLLQSGLQIDVKHLHEFVRRVLGDDRGAQRYEKAFWLLFEGLSEPMSPEIRKTIMLWLFEELPIPKLHELWEALRMKEQATFFWREYIQELLNRGEYRRALASVRDHARVGLNLESCKTSYAALLRIWQELGMQPWYWTEKDGVPRFQSLVQQREEIKPSFFVV